jgi:hypothetical protein
MLEMIFYPNDHDILLGRGRPFQSHPGNKRMKKMVDPYRSVYQSSPRNLRATITEHVIRVIRSSADEEVEEDSTPPYYHDPYDPAYRRQASVVPARFLKLDPKYQEDNSSWRWAEASYNEIFNKISHCLRHKEHTTHESKPKDAATPISPPDLLVKEQACGESAPPNKNTWTCSHPQASFFTSSIGDACFDVRAGDSSKNSTDFSGSCSLSLPYYSFEPIPVLLTDSSYQEPYPDHDSVDQLKNFLLGSLFSDPGSSPPPSTSIFD